MDWAFVGFIEGQGVLMDIPQNLHEISIDLEYVRLQEWFFCAGSTSMMTHGVLDVVPLFSQGDLVTKLAAPPPSLHAGSYGGFQKWGYPQIIHLLDGFSMIFKKNRSFRVSPFIETSILNSVSGHGFRHSDQFWETVPAPGRTRRAFKDDEKERWFGRVWTPCLYSTK